VQKLKVAILGATGAVGQRFIQLLDNHPWFEVSELIGKSSAGKRYGDAVNWILDDSPPKDVLDIVVKPLDGKIDSLLVFSALPKEAAKEREVELANAGHVICTNASAHRMADDVPLMIPEVNHEHIKLIDIQRENRGWTTGALVANSNCTTMPVVMSLKPLAHLGIEKIHMVSEQATSGAGYPGVSVLDIMDNVIPYVSGDENKMETETLKMLGEYSNGAIICHTAVAGATCTRVPVIDGHLVNMSISLTEKLTAPDIIALWENAKTPEHIAQLPSAPSSSVQYLHAQDRPQIRRDRMAGNGMMTSIGRLRECPILDYKFATLSHNTIRGAAGSSIFNAELLAVSDYLDGFSPS